MKNLKKFSDDPNSQNELDKCRQIIRTILVNDKMNFPAFEVVTGISREYLTKISVEDKAVKYDACMVMEFFERGKYLDFYDKECLPYHSRMRSVVSYLKKQHLNNMEIFKEFENSYVVEEDPGVIEIVPMIGFFGKLMLSKNDVIKYELTPLEIIVIGQILCANVEVQKKMNLTEEEISIIKENFVIYIPALFIRHCPISLPVMILPELIEKIKRLKNRNDQDYENSLIISKIEEERMIFVDDNDLKIPDVAVTDGSILIDKEMLGIVYVENKSVVYVRDEGEGAVCDFRDRMKEKFLLDAETKIAEDEFVEICGHLDVQSRVVLSRVCKTWYIYVRKMNKFSEALYDLSPKGQITDFYIQIITVLSFNRCDIRIGGFVYYIFGYLDRYKYDVPAFMDFLMTYVNPTRQVIPGVLLLLAIFFCRSSYFEVGVAQELIDIYAHIGSRSRYIIRKGILKGPIRCTGYSFKRRRLAYEFDGLRYVPSKNVDRVWTGWESVPLGLRKFDRGRFHNGLKELICFK
jgi:hypothetical protein